MTTTKEERAAIRRRNEEIVRRNNAEDAKALEELDWKRLEILIAMAEDIYERVPGNSPVGIDDEVGHYSHTFISPSSRSRPTHRETRADRLKELDAQGLVILHWFDNFKKSAFAMTTCEVTYRDQEAPRKFLVRGKSGRLRILSYLAAFGCTGFPYVLVSGNSLDVHARGEVANHAALRPDGSIEVSDEVRPLTDETLPLMREAFTSTYGEPKLVKVKVEKVKERKVCEEDGCRLFVTHHHARLCKEHQRLSQNQKRKERRERAKATPITMTSEEVRV